jgi:hypothetical protein
MMSDVIWDALWIGTNVKVCFIDISRSAMRIGNDMTRRFHDQFEVIFGLEQMIEDDVMTKF